MGHATEIVVFAGITILSLIIMYLINQVQENPYMDEIFHIRQVKHYCHGNFSVWDPMITTLPGLYLVTAGILKPFILLLDAELVCSVMGLRLINVLFQAGTFYVQREIYKTIHSPATVGKDVGRMAIMTAVTLTLFPLLYFFTFLYYTDPGSTFFVLLMYLFHLRGNKSLAAFMGGVSILFRQSNVVWVVFMAGLTAADVVQEWMKSQTHVKKKDITSAPTSDGQVILNFLKLLFTNFKSTPQNIVKLIANILIGSFYYICVIGLFGLFVHYNGGIVVGDKSQHEACLNFPQVFYFVSFSIFFLSPYTISPSRIINFILFSVNHVPFTVAFLAMSYALVNKYTYVHLYLISDNRHYTFYVWNKIYESRIPYIRYALIPAYYYGIFSLFQTMKHKNVFWKIVFSVCLLAATIPQKLLEFRYFILPYVIYRLNVKDVSWMNLLLEIIIYVLVNAFTIYMFIARPFKWADIVEPQRFMW
ncbi:putative Dol-P-Glc:Glc(2)Man(9)GlcNAc(2)-PP-Dol alpha-1,2-glucosyltransferase [Saccostrea cucullata]|uniref:putative Dol-P-Glc:Glc(2)Man(9)GlcNAc(2)-PP-Dol alpha-1,2-glucosyltransferase n=1 Tax=Saccostrea cuccullata TaxID=36930 RepID=UPI002ED59233